MQGVQDLNRQGCACVVQDIPVNVADVDESCVILHGHACAFPAAPAG